MIFSELYSVYYKTVAQILKKAVEHPLQKNELREIIQENAFEESILNIEPALLDGRWQLLKSDGTAVIQNEPTMPMTTLQKQWLKAIFQDERIRLFQEDIEENLNEKEVAIQRKNRENLSKKEIAIQRKNRENLNETEVAIQRRNKENLNDKKETIYIKYVENIEIEPLFTAEDFCVFDKYSDGDDYTDENYIKNFRSILDAIKKQYPLSIDTYNHKGKNISMVILPKYLEYSEKDDKFRLIGLGKKFGGTVNLGRITKCERYKEEDKSVFCNRIPPRTRSVIFELVDERKALERVLLDFAHFEKQAEKTGDNRYKITINYDKDDETELVIRILSFGPMIKVTAPVHFQKLIKDRLQRQKEMGKCLR